MRANTAPKDLTEPTIDLVVSIPKLSLRTTLFVALPPIHIACLPLSHVVAVRCTGAEVYWISGYSKLPPTSTA
jgi:hypothetical protein